MNLGSKVDHEKRILLLFSRSQLDKTEVNELRKLMSTHMDWSKVFGWLHIHGLVGIAWRNINKYFFQNGTEKCIYGKFINSIKHLYTVQKIRAELQLRQTLEVCRELEDNHIKYALLKGVVLSQYAYEDICSRDFKDNDILIHSNQVDAAIQILKEKGYIQGIINQKNGSVLPVSRRELVIRSMVSHEVIPLIKHMEETPFFEHHTLDLQFSIDIMSNRRTDQVVEQMLNRSHQVNVNEHMVTTLQWEDFLLFILVHFYKEATCELDVMAYKDLLLYKVVDIYNFITSPKIQMNWDIFLLRVEQLNLFKEVYYSLYFTTSIYGEIVPRRIMDILEVSDKRYFDEVYYYNSKEVAIKWDSNIFDRMFDTNRPSKTIINK